MSKKKKGAIAGVAAAVVIVCAAGAGNATYTINEQEQAVVTTFGVSHAVTDPGLHFKIPFVQYVTKVNTTIQSLRIGYDNNNDVVSDESIMITSDFNFVDVDFYLEYHYLCPHLFRRHRLPCYSRIMAKEMSMEETVHAYQSRLIGQSGFDHHRYFIDQINRTRFMVMCAVSQCFHPNSRFCLTSYR